MQTFEKFAQVLNTIQALLMSLGHMCICLKISSDLNSFVFMEIVNYLDELIAKKGSALRAIQKHPKNE